MAIIKIDTDLLRQSSTKIAGKITELEGLNTNLNNQIETIKSGWEGKASENYYALMKKYHGRAAQMVQIFTELKKYADTTVNEFEALDKTSANRIRNSF